MRRSWSNTFPGWPNKPNKKDGSCPHFEDNCHLFFRDVRVELWLFIGNNPFALLSGVPQGCGGSAPIVEHTGHHRVGGIDHPPVSAGNRKPAGHRFQRWVQGAVIVGNILSGAEISQNKNPLNLRVLLFLVLQNRSCQAVKIPLTAQVKGCRALFYELSRHRIEPFFNVAVLRKLCVPAKSHNHTASPCINLLAYKV